MFQKLRFFTGICSQIGSTESVISAFLAYIVLPDYGGLMPIKEQCAPQAHKDLEKSTAFEFL
jgi:hypothetical protein